MPKLLQESGFKMSKLLNESRLEMFKFLIESRLGAYILSESRIEVPRLLQTRTLDV